jgi:hypothetical protein
MAYHKLLQFPFYDYHNIHSLFDYYQKDRKILVLQVNNMLFVLRI